MTFFCKAYLFSVPLYISSNDTYNNNDVNSDIDKIIVLSLCFATVPGHEPLLHIFWGSTGLQPPKDIPQSSHGRVFHEKFCSAYVVKGV